MNSINTDSRARSGSGENREDQRGGGGGGGTEPAVCTPLCCLSVYVVCLSLSSIHWCVAIKSFLFKLLYSMEKSVFLSTIIHDFFSPALNNLTPLYMQYWHTSSTLYDEVIIHFYDTDISCCNFRVPSHRPSIFQTTFCCNTQEHRSYSNHLCVW